MLAERKTSNTRGWSEIWEADEVRIKSAIRRIRRLTGLSPNGFDGVSFSTRKETWHDSVVNYKVVGLEPSQEELESAPRALRRMFRDLGIKPEDKVALEFSSGFTGFDFTVKPEEITEDRVGITLSTSPSRAAVIALLNSSWPWEDGKAMSDTFTHGIGESRFLSFRGERVRMIAGTYGYICRNFSVNEPRSWHPDMVEMLSRAAIWGTALVSSRSKSSPEQGMI